MLKLLVKDLRPNMTFTKPLYNEKRELVILGETPLKEEDINKLNSKGIREVYTFGEIDNPGVSEFDIERDKIKQFKKSLALQIDKLKNERDKISINPTELELGESSENFSKAKRITDEIKSLEDKLDTIEIFENMMENFNFGLNSFIRNDKNDFFIEKLLDITNIITEELKKSYYNLLELVGFLDVGKSLVTEAIKTAILAEYISLDLRILDKNLLQSIGLGALLHDIGFVSFFKVNSILKLKVPNEKLNLPVSHPVYGYKTALEILKLSPEVGQMILNHHEQPDGQGFPRKIREGSLSIIDTIIGTSVLTLTLLKKNEYTGFEHTIKQIRHLTSVYPQKFDMRLIEKILLIPDIVEPKKDMSF